MDDMIAIALLLLHAHDDELAACISRRMAADRMVMSGRQVMWPAR